MSRHLSLIGANQSYFLRNWRFEKNIQYVILTWVVFSEWWNFAHSDHTASYSTIVASHNTFGRLETTTFWGQLRTALAGMFSFTKPDLRSASAFQREGFVPLPTIRKFGTILKRQKNVFSGSFESRKPLDLWLTCLEQVIWHTNSFRHFGADLINEITNMPVTKPGIVKYILAIFVVLYQHNQYPVLQMAEMSKVPADPFWSHH
jgi:hypothetical protein